MTKKNQLILMFAHLFVGFWNSHAQEAHYAGLRFSKPSKITVNSFNVDYPGASAIFLLNDGHTDVYYDRTLDIWKASTTYLYRIKVLQSEGLDIANFEIPLRIKGNFANKEERIRDLKATTYNYNEIGYIELEELSETDVIRNKVKKGVEVVSFALPKVKVNSIIEVSYVIDSPFLADLDDWYFQKDHPVLRSKYSVSIWNAFQYAFVLSGPLEPWESPIVSHTYTEKTWEMRGIQGFQREPFITSRQDQISKVALQLNAVSFYEKGESYLKSWSDVTKDLRENKWFNSFYTEKGNGTKIPSDSLSFAMKLYKNFKDDFTWDGKFGVLPNVGIRGIDKKRIGNSSAMGLKLFHLLKSAKFNVAVVKSSPRSNGKLLKNYPLTERLLVTLIRLEIGDKFFLLDPISDIPFGYVDKDFINGAGLILGDTVAWHDLTVDAYEEKTGHVHVDVTDEFLNVDLSYSLGGYAALASFSDLQSINAEWDLTNVHVDEKGSTLKSVSATVNKEFDEDIVFFPLAFDKLMFPENPFKSSERTYPIDFYFKKKYNYTLTIDLSETLEFEVLPKSQMITSEDNELSLFVDVKKDGYRVEIEFQFYTNKTTFSPGEYPTVKAAYELMEELKNLDLVIRRK